MSIHTEFTGNFLEDFEDVDPDKVDPIETSQIDIQGTWHTRADSLFLASIDAACLVFGHFGAAKSADLGQISR